MRAAKDVNPHQESKCPIQSPKHIKDYTIIEQESFSSGTGSYALAQEESSPTTKESWTTDQTGFDSSMQRSLSTPTPENTDTDDKIKVKEDPSNVERSNPEEEKSNVEEEKSNVERSNPEEEKSNVERSNPE